ncbi:MAG TPA: hypothetical protein VGG66_02840 [Rhizomicrobium sp.]|jgi:hypothetical protein
MSILVRRAGVTLALAAMALWALLPVGWMPNPGGFSQSPLIICPHQVDDAQDFSQSDMAADMPMDMPMDSGGHSHRKGGGDRQPCPFGAAPHLAATTMVGNIAVPVFVGRISGKVFLAASLTRANVYQPQAPRAPPNIAQG